MDRADIRLKFVVMTLRIALAVTPTIFWSFPAAADSWAPPETRTYMSPSKTVRLTVIPRELSSALGYFEDKMDAREPAGQRKGGNANARGILERRDPTGQWTPLWDKPLVNDVGPVEALVADSSDYVVTFDNWHSLGHGENVVVVYGPSGRLVRSLTLTDIVPQTYVRALPHSVSSISWRGEPRIAEQQLILPITVPATASPDNPLGDSETFVEATIDLASGQLHAHAGAAWSAALAAADRVNAENDEAAAAQLAWFKAPLFAPQIADEQAWHEYLRESFLRLASDWQEGSTGTTVLRLPDAPDYRPSVKWVHEALKEDHYEGEAISFASPVQDNLVKILIDAARRVPDGKLKGVRVYVAVGDALWPQVTAALAHSGAEMIQIDPAKPIPQRPERLRELEDEAASRPQ